MAPAPTARARLQASTAALVAAAVALSTRHPAALAVFAVAFALATLAWLSPVRYAPVQRGLDAVTRAVVAAFSWLVLGLVYFGVFTPLRLLRAVLRRDPLALHHRPASDSYLLPLPARSSHFDRQF